MRRVVGVRDTLWKLQARALPRRHGTPWDIVAWCEATFNSGLGDASDEQIRMFATEAQHPLDPQDAP